MNNKSEREEEKTSEQRRGSYFNPLNMSVLLKLLIVSSTEVNFSSCLQFSVCYTK